jgi:hypothetical protein
VAQHILVSLESVHLLDPETLSRQGVTAVVVAYRLLPELCPAEVQQTKPLRLSSTPLLPCSHAMVSLLLIMRIPCAAFPMQHARLDADIQHV